MSRIVAGKFDRSIDADAALDMLARDGFTRAEIDAFYVSPPGQNDLTPVGGDAPHSSEGSRGAGRGAAIGAAVGAVAGLIIGSLIELQAAFFACGLGALIGAFAGAMATVRQGRRSEASIEHPVESRGGRMIAVCVDRAGTEPVAVQVLRTAHAREVGVTQGDWRDGSWRDFDPRQPLPTV